MKMVASSCRRPCWYELSQHLGRVQLAVPLGARGHVGGRHDEVQSAAPASGVAAGSEGNCGGPRLSKIVSGGVDDDQRAVWPTTLSSKGSPAT